MLKLFPDLRKGGHILPNIPLYTIDIEPDGIIHFKLGPIEIVPGETTPLPGRGIMLDIII